MAYLIQARFVLPFRLGLSDVAFSACYNNSLTFIKIKTGQGLQTNFFRIPDARNKNQKREWLRASPVLESGKEVISRTVCINQEDELFLEETSDFLGYTLIDVNFEVLEAPKSGAGPEIEKLQEEAFRRVQWFIRQYRTVSDELDVRVPEITDSPIILIAGADDYQISGQVLEGKFKLLSRQFRWLPAEATGIAKPEWDQAKIRRLETKLARGAEIPIFEELFLEAKQLSKVQQNHRLAIVVIGNAFELFVREALHKECVRRNLRQLPFRDGKMASMDELVETADLRSELLGTCAKHLVGRSIKSCSEYQAWHTKGYIPRNEILHRGRTMMFASDVEVAFISTVNYSNRISRFFAESRHN